MDLKKLHKRLYQKNSKIEEKRDLSEDRFDPEDTTHSNSFVKSTGVNYKDTIDPEKKGFFQRNKTLGIILIVIASLVILMTIAFGVYWYMQGAFAEERVKLGVQGIESVESGDTLEYKITMFNDNRAVLNNAVLNVTYSNEIEPKNFTNWEENGLNRKKIVIGTIGSQEIKEYTIPFSVFGAKDTRVYLDVSLEYQPENLNSLLKKNVQGSSLIEASPLQVELVVTKDVASGEKMKVNIIVDNKSERLFENVEIDVNYPEQFLYKESNIVPTEGDNKWVIGNIKPTEQENIVIQGLLSGVTGLAAPFSVTIGRYDQNERKLIRYSEASDVSNIVSSRMEISQLVKTKSSDVYSTENKTADSGTVAEYKIQFKNTSDTELRDLVLKTKVLSRVIKDDEIEAKGGYYDKEKREITWKASGVPILKKLLPGEGGEVSFVVKMKDEFPADSEEDKNFTLKTQASIGSLDINSPIAENKEIYSNEIVVKVNSRFLFDFSGKFADLEIPNSGPLPPEIGEKTTFTHRLILRNTSNDMKNIKFSATLPPDITWENNYIPKDANVSFNERSGELVYEIGEIKAGTGFYLPMKSFAFQIGTVPPVNKEQTNNMLLLTNMKIEAEDVFTGNRFENTIRDFKVTDLADY